MYMYIIYVPSPQPAAPLSSEDRLAQQRLYGVHYDDDYDYLQHLKEPGTAVMEPAVAMVGEGGREGGREVVCRYI